MATSAWTRLGLAVLAATGTVAMTACGSDRPATAPGIERVAARLSALEPGLTRMRTAGPGAYDCAEAGGGPDDCPTFLEARYGGTDVAQELRFSLTFLRGEVTEACVDAFAGGSLAFRAWARNVEDWQARPATEPLPPRSAFDQLLQSVESIRTTCAARP